jgi:copper chaperone
MGTKETVLNVEGMTCMSCVRHIEGALRKLEGIGEIEVKVRDGKVRVQHDETKASLAQVIEAISEAGYEARTGGA